MSESNFVNSKTTSLLDDKWNILQEQPFGKLQLEAAGAALAFGKYLWAEDLELWFSELSELSSVFIKFSVYNKDPSSCLPSCPIGYTFTGVEEDRSQCAKCPNGAALGQTAPGVWRCSQPGLPSSNPTIRSRALRNRTYKATSCPEGSFSDPDGMLAKCHACGTNSVATPASISAGAPEAGPFYDENADIEYYAIIFDSAISGTNAPLCVPEACCASSAGEYTGEGDQEGVDDSQNALGDNEFGTINSQVSPDNSNAGAAPSSMDVVPAPTEHNEAHLQAVDGPQWSSLLTEGRR